MSHQSTELPGCRKAFEDRYGKARLLLKRGGTIFGEEVPEANYVDCGIQSKWEDWQECWSVAIASVKREPQWLPIEDAPKGRKLIVGYFNKLGNWRTIIARYYLPGTLAAHEDADESQCDEEGYAKEGWYEESETHEFIMPTDEEPLYYMLLTPPPVAATTASKGDE